MDQQTSKDENFNEFNCSFLNSKMTEQEVANHMKLIMKELETLPKEKRKAAAQISVKKIFGSHLPDSLLHLSSGLILEGDVGASLDEKPAWLDMEKIRKGQKFRKDYFFAITYNELLGLFPLLAFDLGLNPFIFTGHSSTPYTAFKRYLSTHFRMDSWYTSDLTTRGTPAYNDMRYTRHIHNIVRKKLSTASVETYEKNLNLGKMWSNSTETVQQDFKSASPIAEPAQCPYAPLSTHFPNQAIQHASQGAMSVTQFGFCGLIVCKPEMFGIHNATYEELDAFCHLWRYFGYLLGIDDDYNFCRGTVEDVRNCSKDILEYWVKPNFQNMKPECEHMLRCLTESIQYYYPLTNFDCIMLHVSEILDVPMPRFCASLSYSSTLLHYFSRFHFHYGSKISGEQEIFNYTLKRAMLYAKNFDEEKHKQLKLKSEKTLAFSTRKPTSENPAQMNSTRFLAIQLILVLVTSVCAITLF